MTNKEKLKYIKVLMLIYVISFFVINWNDVSWIFNYKEVYGLVDDFFNPYPSIDASSMSTFFPNHSTDSAAATKQQDEVKEVKAVYTEKNNVLEIPAISLSTPIVFSQSTDKAAITKDLDSGVVFYPGSVYPGQKGQMVILGHSAPPNWPKIKHDWVFSNLGDLNTGDTVLVNINHKQYSYKVKQKIIIKRGQDLGTVIPATNTNSLILVSCWPPGKDYQRIAVETELFDS